MSCNTLKRLYSRHQIQHTGCLKANIWGIGLKRHAWLIAQLFCGTDGH